MWQSTRFDTICIILKNMKNTHGGVLLLVKLQAETWNFTKSNTHPWVLFTFFKLYKWYKIPQSVNISFLFSLKKFENQRFSDVFRGNKKRALTWNGLNLREIYTRTASKDVTQVSWFITLCCYSITSLRYLECWLYKYFEIALLHDFNKTA